jgi:peptide/nickel transport system substrate-binding protein
MPSVSSREFGLRTGELDIIEGLKEEQWVEKIASFPQVTVKAFGPCEVQMLNFNMTKKPFDDIRVRKAFSYAVSREEVAAFMGKSLAVPIYSAALAPPAPGALTKEEAEKAGVVYENNIEKAKQLLAEAGYSTGFNTTIIAHPTLPDKNMAVAVQSDLSKIGITCDVQYPTTTAFTAIQQGGTWKNGVLFSPTNAWGNPNVAISRYLTPSGKFCQSTKKPDGFDELLKQSLTSPEADPALVKQLEDVIYNDCTIIPITDGAYAWILTKNVMDSGIDSFATNSFWDQASCWLKK